MKQLAGALGVLLLGLAACQPTETTTKADEAEPAGRDTPATEPTPTPPAYVGSWAAERSWCANTLGPERPIMVTETTFNGYENTCQITQLEPTEEGWNAVFVCQAEGTTSNRSVRMVADDGRLEITWLDEGYAVEWNRCRA